MYDSSAEKKNYHFFNDTDPSSNSLLFRNSQFTKLNIA